MGARLATAVLAVALALCAAGPARAVPEAAYGLHWGMAVDEVLDLGWELEYVGRFEDWGDEYYAHRYPPWLDDVAQVILFFGFDDRLWRIAVISNGYRSDGHGENLLARYEEMKVRMEEVYGPGVEQRHFDPQIQAHPENVLGTFQMGWSWLFTDYETESEKIQLGIRPGNVAEARWGLYIKSKALEPLERKAAEAWTADQAAKKAAEDAAKNAARDTTGAAAAPGPEDGH